MNKIRVGNAQAFWGDRPSAAKELLSQVPELDYLTMDYLAEVSMSILALQRDRNPQTGYPQDFVEVVRGLAPYWGSGGRCKLIANAGGLNPAACARACQAVLEQAGCRSMKIGIVTGDDVLGILKMNESLELFDNLDTRIKLRDVVGRLVTANAYMGCRGIVQALEMGADLVITGRVADPSMVAAACAFHFGWSLEDWDRMAAATVAGHLLECGTHVTGGILTDWMSIPDPTHLGFPIAEVDQDGGLVITKSSLAGGCVTEATVKEQLLYEISNPDCYISPDVEVSFLGLKVQQEGRDRVAVRGAIGRPRPKTIKVSATYRDGYRAAGTLTLVGEHAVEKGYRCGQIVLDRLRDAGWHYTQTVVECLGNGESVPVMRSLNEGHDSYETVLRIAVESSDKDAVEAFSKEMIPLVTAGPQGTTGYAQGRPSVQPVFRYWPCLIDEKVVPWSVDLIETASPSPSAAKHSWPKYHVNNREKRGGESSERGNSTKPALQAPKPRRLKSIAYGRSGDKGIHANIGILVRDPADYAWLCKWLTSERVHDFFRPMGLERVERFEAPNLCGINFLLYGVLNCSIRNDAQGKALAQALLTISIPDEREV